MVFQGLERPIVQVLVPHAEDDEDVLVDATPDLTVDAELYDRATHELDAVQELHTMMMAAQGLRGLAPRAGRSDSMRQPNSSRRRLVASARVNATRPSRSSTQIVGNSWIFAASQ